jgi:hypothetical protein
MLPPLSWEQQGVERPAGKDSGKQGTFFALKNEGGAATHLEFLSPRQRPQRPVADLSPSPFNYLEMKRISNCFFGLEGPGTG